MDESIITDTSASVKRKRGRPKGSAQHPLDNRTETQNKRTVNRMVNLFDMVLEQMSERVTSPNAMNNPVQWKEILEQLRTLGYMLDPMLRRWYLVHKGYDSNVKQAHVDTEAKAEKDRKKLQNKQPLEEQITEVAHYDPAMQEIIEELQKETKEAIDA